MAQEYGNEDAWGKFFSDLNTRIRDLEEKQRLLRDKLLLIGDGFVKERDRNFQDMQELKKTVIKLEDDNKRLRDLLMRISDLIDKTARKEELMILQRQFDLFKS